jgi:hypothetical protein
MVIHRPMLRLAWFFLRAAFWLGLLSLFVPGSLPFQAITAGQGDSVVERAAQDTLSPADRVASWREPRTRN